MLDFYAARLRGVEGAAAAAGRRARGAAQLRLLLFAAAAALAVAGAAREGAPGWTTLWLAAGAVAVAFVIAVRRHARLRAEHGRQLGLAALNREAVARLRRDWAALAEPAWAAAPVAHPYADDLDLFGPAGLVRLLAPVSAAPGRTTLRGWLLAPATPTAIADRQQAVAELAPLVELREEIALRARGVWLGAAALERFVAWAEAPGWLAQRPAVLWAARLLPAATITLAVLQGAGVVARPLWWAPLLAAGALAAAHRRALGAAVSGAVPEAQALAQYAGLFELVARAAVESPALRRLQAALAADGLAAHAQVAALRRLADAAETRRSPMLHVAVQLALLWDFHVAWLLERWKRGSGRHLRGWLAALGEAEALAALGALAHENPGWGFPEVSAAADRLEGEALGHPLIAADALVPNDVTVGPPGRFLLVTGSNMAGKSTLIRAVGLNVVLAQCGAPVCARRLRCPPLAMATSIRVHDSLERGVSYFMAELERLGAIVGAARAAGDARAAGGPAFLFLLDEMLQGTNSAERTIAARRVLGHLVGAGAIGAVTTHDLALADPPPDPPPSGGRAGAVPDPAARLAWEAAVPVHFAEQVGGANGRVAMTFDYRMRAGVATSTNALRLLEIVGL